MKVHAITEQAGIQRLGGHQRLILEYKLFEPPPMCRAGDLLAHCLQLGERAQVCVDTGHHAPGMNIEFIVATLLRAGKPGAFDFSSRFCADATRFSSSASCSRCGQAEGSVRTPGDVLGADAVLMDAYNTGVRPLLAGLRADMGLSPDPMAAYASSGYGERVIAERAGGRQAGWGA